MTDQKQIQIGKNLTLGNALPLVLIAGPCALENRDHVLKVADSLVTISNRLNIGLIFKTSFDKANRSHSESPRGIGIEDSVPIFSEIRERFKIPILTDVHLPDQCEILKDVVDVLQIPAFLCRQTDLLVAAAETGCVVNVKKGQFLSPNEMKNVVSKIQMTGNDKILLTERGTTFGYNNLVSDFRSLPIMKDFGFPVVFDATHSVQRPGGMGTKTGGDREYVEILSRAAVAVGCAALFVETHPSPDNAPSDGPNMLPLGTLEGMMKQIIAIDLLTKDMP